MADLEEMIKNLRKVMDHLGIENASAENKPVLQVPQEIWDRVTSNNTPRDALNANKAMRRTFDKNFRDHYILWASIFKNESWLKLAVSLGASPCLVGRDLSVPRNQNSESSQNMILLSLDWDGDLQFQKDVFWNSLQDGYKYDEDNLEVRFTSQVTLNVSDIVRPGEVTQWSDNKQLFNEPPSTMCCIWEDPDRKIRQLTETAIVGVGGPAKVLSSVSPVCCLNLSLPSGILRQWMFCDKDYDLKRTITETDSLTGRKIGFKIVDF